MFTKDIEELKKKQTEMNNTRRNKQQNNWGRRMDKWPGRQMVEITTTEQNIEKRMKRNEDRLRDLRDNIKHTNICIIGVPEGEERERKDLRIYLKR